jgi:hypothetical protein
MPCYSPRFYEQNDTKHASNLGKIRKNMQGGACEQELIFQSMSKSADLCVVWCHFA